ncbi:MAG: 1,4-dihydroxy-2-naphthoate polyprenyltransferase [Candidatus Kariarchaeaceae archaeon]|jgi:1,4-dihydroxy-2-naphthoate octaprenyltransferase
MKSKVQVWLMAIRPKTLPAAIGPVFVGSAFALDDDKFKFLPAFAALLGALLLQIGANLANDYFDFIKGTDPDERKGPTRVAASGLLDKHELRNGLIAVIAASLIVGLYLIYVGKWPILLIGFFSIVFLLTYSGGPWPFGYHGLGDFFVFIFFGFIAVSGTYYVQSLSISFLVIVGSIPSGALITAILVVNNYRDLSTDKETGKKTLAVIIGPKLTVIEYILLFIVAYLTPVYLLIQENFSIWVFLPWLTIPLTVRLINTLKSTNDGPTLNKTLAKTAQLNLIFSLLFSIGITV